MFKKTLLILLLMSLMFATEAFAEIIIAPPPPVHKNPPIKAAVKKPLPLFLLRRVNLTGNLTVPQALSLLTRSSGYSFIVDSNNIDTKKTQNYYFIDKPLYQVLKAVVLAHGYYYSADTKTKTVTVQGFVTRVFHLPLSALSSSFSAQTGMSGINNGMAGSGSANQTQASASPAAGGAATTQGTQSSPGQTGFSNPGGTISMGMSESGSFDSYLKKALKSMTSKKGKFSIDSRHGIIWVRDYYSNVRRIGRFLNKIGKRMQSTVLLKVEVIDVGLNKNFQAGINWNTVFNNAFKSNALSASSIAIGMPLASGAGVNNAPNISFSSASGANQAVLNALSTQGQTKVLSEPRLMLIDGQTRTIASGEIDSYVQTIETLSYGVGSATSTYPVIAQVQTGIGISFTPTIDKKTGEVTVTINFVDNNITGYNSFSIGGNSFSNPIIQSKSFTDTVRVKSGRTAIIGGILTTNINKQTYGVPILENIPVLGNLFKAANNTKTKDDLVIMITPVITGGE
ncbi:MAG: type II secretion system protein GspD [bacterium]